MTELKVLEEFVAHTIVLTLMQERSTSNSTPAPLNDGECDFDLPLAAIATHQLPSNTLPILSSSALEEDSNFLTRSLIEIISDGGNSALVVSIQELHKCIEINDIDLLQIAMKPNTQIDETLRAQLLLGLLRQRKNGLTLLKEDLIVIAPIPEIAIPIISEGTISYLRVADPDIPDDPPDLYSLCRSKRLCHAPVHRIIGFILDKLKSLPSTDSLIDSFRLKSYSSVMNKLFYRGKDLTDLFATTFHSDEEFKNLKTALSGKGAMERSLDTNGNGCRVYRYVRILQVELNGHSFHFPVYYELVRERYKTSVPHEHYELSRLEYGPTEPTDARWFLA